MNYSAFSGDGRRPLPDGWVGVCRALDLVRIRLVDRSMPVEDLALAKRIRTRSIDIDRSTSTDIDRSIDLCPCTSVDLATGHRCGGKIRGRRISTTIIFKRARSPGTTRRAKPACRDYVALFFRNGHARRPTQPVASRTLARGARTLVAAQRPAQVRAPIHRSCLLPLVQ